MRFVRTIAPILLLLAGSFVRAEAPSSPRLQYPQVRTADVVDDYHGTRVTDPYRWLEEASSPAVDAFVAAHNALVAEFVDTPARPVIRKRLLEIWDYPKVSPPARRDGYWFFTRNDGLQNQSVVYVQESLSGPPRVLIDPNTMSQDGTVALAGTYYTRDGALVAYGVSSGGSDQKEIRVRSTATGQDLADVLKWCKFASVAWAPDNSGFYYNRYPSPGTVAPEDQANFNRVYWHKLGTPQEQDVLVYERPDDKTQSFGPQVTDDGKFLLLYVSRGSTPKNRLYYRRVADTSAEFVKLLDDENARYSFIENVGDTFFIHTDLDAPRGRVMAIDVNEPARDNWKEVIPQSDAKIISSVRMINGQLVVTYRVDATHRLSVFDRDGKTAGDIELPGVGSVGAVTGQRDHTEMFFSFTSPTQPPTTLRYDLPGRQLSVFHKTDVKFDPDQYQTVLEFATSRDETRVPLFITHRRDLKRDGSNPTILEGYGGFNVSLGPRFDVAAIPWLEQGGVHVTAILRGGGEYGETWHRAGKLENKQNVFDDFIAAAEYLCTQGYTNPKRLAIEGGSNGGLLVATCMLQRPQQFGAVVCKVPVTDMLRYHRFTVGRFWIPEYGNAQTDPGHFKFMYAYSPLHNIKPGAEYPPILVTTGDGDDRVLPAHARKFVATLQSVTDPDNIILLRTQARAGHGAGKPTQKVIDEAADRYAFLARVLGMNWKPTP